MTLLTRMFTGKKPHNNTFDVYRGRDDARLRVAVLQGAGLPPHFVRKDWTLLPQGTSPLHSEAARDVLIRGFCFFKLEKGK